MKEIFSDFSNNNENLYNLNKGENLYDLINIPLEVEFIYAENDTSIDECMFNILKEKKL